MINFDKILKNIKEIKIQGARNIARAALKAYYLIPTKTSKNKQNLINFLAAGVESGGDVAVAVRVGCGTVTRHDVRIRREKKDNE